MLLSDEYYDHEPASRTYVVELFALRADPPGMPVDLEAPAFHTPVYYQLYPSPDQYYRMQPAISRLTHTLHNG
jgi:hypothetical protein